MPGKPKAETPGSDLAVQVAAEVATSTVRDGDIIGAYLRREDVDTDATREAIHQSIIQDIMEAESLDDVLVMLEGQKLEEFEGRVIELQKVTVQDSDYEQGARVYFSLKGVDVETGQKFLINTGEQAVMAQCLKIEQLAGFPYRVRPMKASRPNNYGRYPFRLVKAD